MMWLVILLVFLGDGACENAGKSNTGKTARRCVTIPLPVTIGLRSSFRNWFAYINFFVEVYS